MAEMIQSQKTMDASEYPRQTKRHSSRLLRRDVSRIRVAVAGLGKMGTYHLQAIQQLANGESEEYYKAGLDDQICKLELCGVCDPLPEQTRRIALEIPLFTEWQELLETIRPDLAVIASPTSTHFDLALASLEAGVHTFVEKPLVTTLKEFKHLTEAAARQGCRLISGHVERYNPVAMKLCAMLSEGQVVADHYRFQRTQPHDVRIADDIITDKIIHDLDLAQYFFGAIAGFELLDFKQFEGQAQEASVRLCHANGIEGTLLVSWLRPEGRTCREVCITCKDGRRVEGDFSGKELRIDGQRVSCEMPGWVKPDNNQIKDELADFIAWCLVPDPALPQFEPLLRPMEIEATVEIIETLLQRTGSK